MSDSILIGTKVSQQLFIYYSYDCEISHLHDAYTLQHLWLFFLRSYIFNIFTIFCVPACIFFNIGSSGSIVPKVYSFNVFVVA